MMLSVFLRYMLLYISYRLCIPVPGIKPSVEPLEPVASAFDIHIQWFAAEDEGRTEEPTEQKIRKAPLIPGAFFMRRANE